MKKLLTVAFLSLSGVVFGQQPNAPLFVQDSLKLISSQFLFTEGASTDKLGNVYFTDQPNDKIWKYSVKGELSLFLDKSGRANGTYFDAKGNLIVCADEQNQIWSIDRRKKIKILFSDLDGKKVNGPNDIWIDKKGGIYFTDPYYQRDYWTRQKPELTSENVYYLPKGKKKPIMVSDGLLRPNGIVGTTNGKTLYVADRKGDKTYQFDIQSDGHLSNQRLFINKGSDGMTLDYRGNVYISGKGVEIYSPQGIKIGKIEVPENWVGNLCFGGPQKSTLFIAASKSLYAIKMNTFGIE
ncbi:SMP-30/gluconolactonase/LRE family protein [Pedobacter sp. MW01-1-1]|uniref:SMP-30/gluconolactonase/LRE family protein n=1 Tax=Pedobacter sp. MW01-1-1 TaxID=3383027 RepID=UPI003FEF9F40